MTADEIGEQRAIALARIREARQNQRQYPEELAVALLGEMDWTEEFLKLGGTVQELIKENGHDQLESERTRTR